MNDTKYQIQNTKYSPVIGLEVHVELKTKSKMFCGCSADYFGKEPNTHTCPVCLGLPGALPVPNKTAIEWCIKIGLALNCNIPEFSKFDRKNYFYPDLPKGYQISQYDQPFAVKGSIELSNGKKIGITRVHMEEDTGKLTHADGSTLIDFNRSGVPLVEIVTEPDFESASQVVEYLKKLQQIVRYLDVSNADMEKGDMRLEPNISLKIESSTELPKYKVEVKNINSFRFVQKAIDYELKRQQELLEKGETPTQETRGWDENKQKTLSQRSKEEAHDYRYFPEPDIPPLRFSESQISNIKSQMPKLPSERELEFIKVYNFTPYNAQVSTATVQRADFMEEAMKYAEEQNVDTRGTTNYILNRLINNIGSISPTEAVEEYKKQSSFSQVDEKELENVIKKIISENEKAVQDYKNGKEQALMFLLGAVMRTIGQKLDTEMVKDKIKLHI